jgi:hypothetical protein
MRLEMEKFDGRGRHHSSPIIDRDTNQEVGTCQQVYGAKRVSLFGERYVGAFKSYEECAAFIEGVQAVLNEMSSTEIKREFEADWSDHRVVAKKAS